MTKRAVIKEALDKIYDVTSKVPKTKLHTLFQMYVSGDIPEDEIVAFSNYITRYAYKTYVSNWNSKYFIPRFSILWEAVEDRHKVILKENREKEVANEQRDED